MRASQCFWSVSAGTVIATIAGVAAIAQEPLRPEGGGTTARPPADTEFLDPPANPLAFPTEPEQVQVGEVIPLTLEMAIDLARRNNPDLREARQVLNRSREVLNEQLAALFPTLDLNVSLQRQDTAFNNITAFSVATGGVGGEPTTFINPSLNLNYNLFTGGQRPALIRQAEEQLERDQLNVEVVEAQLRLDVSQAYYEVQRADSQVEIAKAAIVDAVKSLEDAQALERAGLGTRFDVLQAEVRLSDEQQNLRDAQAGQSIARRDLSRILNIDGQAEAIPDGPPAEAGRWNMSLDESIVLALRNRAELEQFLADIAIAEQSQRIARSAARPQVTLGASYEAADIFDDGLQAEDGFSLTANFTWRLFSGGASSAQIRQEEENAAIAATRFEEERGLVRFEVEQAFFTLEAEEENITTAQLSIVQSEESLRLARLRFQAGVGTQTDVINAQTELTNARGNLLNAIVDYNIALATLERAVSNLPDSTLFDLP